MIACSYAHDHDPWSPLLYPRPRHRKRKSPPWKSYQVPVVSRTVKANIPTNSAKSEIPVSSRYQSRVSSNDRMKVTIKWSSIVSSVILSLSGDSCTKTETREKSLTFSPDTLITGVVETKINLKQTCFFRHGPRLKHVFCFVVAVIPYSTLFWFTKIHETVWGDMGPFAFCLT